jgi:acetoin utilization protein AcuB
MRVADLMTREVRTVGPDDPFDEVFLLVVFDKIRHVPVVEKDRVIGIVSDRDLAKVLGVAPRRRGTVVKEGKVVLVLPSRRVRHIMTRGVVTIRPDAGAAAAARLMAERKIGGLPVVDDGGHLVGIITATDILAAFVRLSDQMAASTAAG